MKNQKKIVLVGGCFDFIHYGHISFLTKAKTFGTHLIVALESDENIRRSKGAHRPIHTQKHRLEMLDALRCVDEVLPLGPMKSDMDYITMVEKIRPNVIAVTEGDPILEKKRIQAVQVGAELVCIPKIHTPSTTQLAKLLELE